MKCNHITQFGSAEINIYINVTMETQYWFNMILYYYTLLGKLRRERVWEQRQYMYMP